MGVPSDLEAAAMAEDAHSDIYSVESGYDSEYTLPCDYDDVATVSDWSSDNDSLRSLYTVDGLHRRKAFRLNKVEDISKPVYEGWVVFVAPDEEELISGTRVLGIEARQDFQYPDNRVAVESTDHNQDQLAALHLAALDEYHGAKRASSSCLPLRRIFSRKGRTPYDDAIDGRIRKLPHRVQAELSDLLRDRSDHSSTTTHQREFAVVSIQERLRHRFAKVEATPARRHRFRWWKDNTRGGQETEFFVVVMGTLVNSGSPGAAGTTEHLTHYGRRTNPWRDVDGERVRLGRISARTAALNRVLAHDIRKSGYLDDDDDDYDEAPRAAFPRPALRRRPAPPPPAPVAPHTPGPYMAPTPRPSCLLTTPRIPPPPMPAPHHQGRPLMGSRHPCPFGQAPYPAPPLPPHMRPYGAPHPHHPPPPPYHFSRPAPPAVYRPPVFAQTMRNPLNPLGLVPPHPPPCSPPPPPPFRPGMMPMGGGPMGGPMPMPTPAPHPHPYFTNPSPSSSWPPSPASSYQHSYSHSHPGSSSHGPPPPLAPFTALTTPSSLGSMHIPMFGPIPPRPPPAPAPAAAGPAAASYHNRPPYVLDNASPPSPPSPLSPPIVLGEAFPNPLPGGFFPSHLPPPPPPRSASPAAASEVSDEDDVAAKDQAKSLSRDMEKLGE